MLRVLVADDEPVIADSLALILDQFGYKTTAVYSGENAVAAAGVWGPDVVISDVVMTGISGIEAGIQIRQMLPACRVILFSGQASTEELIRTAASEGHSFELLTKPVHPKVLLSYLTSSVPGSSAT